MKLKDQYGKDGYVVLRNFFSELEISEIASHVDRVYRTWISENESEIFDQKLVNMHSLTDSCYFQDMPGERRKFFEVIAPKKLTDVVESIFGSGINFHNTQLFFNPLNRSRLPYWHRDMQYSPIEEAVQRSEQRNMLSLHVRIPLVSEKGVELIGGSHERWDTELERNVRFELNGHKNSEPLPNAQLIDLAAGDVVIFNAQMIHRGNYALNASRKALDLCIGKYHPLAAAFLDDRVLPNDKELVGIENNQWYKLAREIADRKPT